jgi:16S rRNA (adenine1518-N6/adenine1519-N6)-dimethyltransferase
MAERTLSVLRRYGIRPSKRAGQHHVIDQSLLERIVGYADVSKSDEVLEIGAGIGNLTRLLAERSRKVIAVERDGRFIKILREQLRGHLNTKIVHGDVLEMELPRFDKVVANLPFGISSDVTFMLLDHDFELAVLMYQWEFAERLIASPGSNDYGRLTVNTYYRAEVELLEKVLPSAFLPQPEVFSAVVRLRPRGPPFEVTDEGTFFNVVRALFQHRRQKVRNALYHSFGQVFPDMKLSKDQRRKLLDEKIPKELADVRVMDLEPEKFSKIADNLNVNKFGMNDKRNNVRFKNS